VVVIEVHVREDLLEHGVDHLTRLQEFVETLRVLSHDHVAHLSGVFAIEVVGHHLAHRQWQDVLPIVVRLLHALAIPFAWSQLRRVDIVAGQRDLLILRKLVEGMVLQVREFLGLDDATHQGHGWILLAVVALTPSAHFHFCHVGRLRLDLDGQHRGVVPHLYLLRLVADTTGHQHMTRTALDGKMAVGVALDMVVRSLIAHISVGHRVAVLGIEDLSRDLCPQLDDNQ